MRVGLLVTGDTSVRAAHSLAAHPGIEEVVVLGPATSKSFRVVEDGTGLDVLVGSGDKAPVLAGRHDIPLVWDGHQQAPGVAVWGASPVGLTLAMASRESEPRLVAVAHPEVESNGNSQSIRFPDPIGRLDTTEVSLGGKPIATAKSPNDFAAALVRTAARNVTIIDQGAFLAGIALAAATTLYKAGEARPVWDDALPYLETVAAMGLVMAESA